MSFIVGEVDTKVKARATATFLFISVDSNVTGINLALMHSPRAPSFQWTPRVCVSARLAKSRWAIRRRHHESLNS